MSLHWRILGAFILITVLAVSLSVGIGFVTTRVQFDAFVENLGHDEAGSLAQSLGSAYTASEDWGTATDVLSQAGYLYDVGGKEHGGEGEGESSEGHEGDADENESAEVIHVDRIRIVIIDKDGAVIYDNFSGLRAGDIAPDLAGHRNAIVDTRTNQIVGYVFVDVNQDFLATESLGFLRTLLVSSALGGLLIAAIALLLAAWLSRRITAPVTALTEATQAIAEQGDTTLLPVTSSDELGQMSVAFNQMTTALQTQRDLRKRLMDDVSHELNTPLSVIQLEAKGLRDGLQTPTRAADQIIQEVNMLHNLVRDLNWLAETESDELRLAIEPCSIQHLLTDEVERWQPQAQAHKITLSLQPLPELPMLNLDRMRMSQALGNVVHNALQHTEVGGRVTLAVTAEMDRGVEVSVTDDGVGIDEADLPHIFDRFYRATPDLPRTQPRSRVTGGTGLGLAIARAIVEAHDGTLAIASDGLGQGTTVRFNLPMY